jgi:hypothetical protein
MRKGHIVATITLLAIAAPAAAQMQQGEARQTCPATPASVPAELAGWAAAQPLAAARDPQGLPAAALTPGKAVDLTLGQTSGLAYAMRPERPGDPVSHGGMAQLKVAKAGHYRVAIDSAAWLDLVAGGKGLESVAHSHGPACSGIRKMVDFRLEPGDYVLQIAGNGSARVRVMVMELPVA